MTRAAAVVLAISCLLAPVPCSAENPRETPIVKVIRQCGPSVVNISTERVVLLQQNPFYGLYRGQFNDVLDQSSKVTIGTMKLKGVGSGVIVSKDGFIVTNAHVVSMASKVYIIFNDGKSYEAQVAAVNQKDDLALLKISPSGSLRPIEFADDVMIGETVVSIGNPFGLENSVSAGIISGTNRNFSSQMNQVIFDSLIQTDASINPGSSGGALLNLEGRLVGINLAVMQGAQSLGFAISVEKIKRLLKEYREYQENASRLMPAGK